MKISILALLALILAVVSLDGSAEERMIAGSQRGSALVADGASDALTAPGRVLTGLAEETREYGVFGLVGGPVRGGIKGGAQALRGGARMLIGILDVLTAPLGGNERVQGYAATRPSHSMRRY